MSDRPANEDFRTTASLERALGGAPIRVGSENAAKAEAVRRAFARFMVPPSDAATAVAPGDPEDPAAPSSATALARARALLDVVPVAVDSGVAEQPVGFEEIIAGARQRSEAALASGPCAMAAGIEDGLVRLPDGLPRDPEIRAVLGESGLYNVGCAWLTDGERASAGFSSGFAYPTGTLVGAVRDRIPIGDLFDDLWRAQRDPGLDAPSGPGAGNIGKLTVWALPSGGLRRRGGGVRPDSLSPERSLRLSGPPGPWHRAPPRTSTMRRDDEPLRGRADLLSYFHAAETPREEWVVGTEHEKVGVYADTGDRVPYEGPYGIGALLEKLAAATGWERVEERGRVIALKHAGASVTLEPGGQIELSGAPLRTARETCAEFNTHVDLVKELSDEFGIAWLGLGIDPFHAVDDIPTMPKGRYDIMRAYLPTRGGHGLEMMHATATVQANFDYADEADMIAKMRGALLATPIVSALFANSSLSGGKENGFVSKRLIIWRDTDPDRCGLIPFVFDPDFGYERYVEWALDVPLFFVVRDGAYHPGDGTTFRQFMDRGFADTRPTMADWDLHLTTLFPDVRLKRIIEVRGADTVPREGICALPALWKGLLYDEAALEAVWRLLGKVTTTQLDAGQLDVARLGLRAQMAGRPVLDWARELVAIASEGLRRIAERGETDQDERNFLDPLHAQIEIGKSPGEVIAERWRGEWGHRPERLIEATRY